MNTLYVNQVGIYIMAKIIRPQNDKSQKKNEKSENAWKIRNEKENLEIEYKYDEGQNLRSKH